jgi:hypothetical protein
VLNDAVATTFSLAAGTLRLCSCAQVVSATGFTLFTIGGGNHANFDVVWLRRCRCSMPMDFHITFE